jgi:hypothetical protein
VAIVGHRNVNRRNKSAAGIKKTVEKHDYTHGYFRAFIKTGKK